MSKEGGAALRLVPKEEPLPEEAIHEAQELQKKGPGIFISFSDRDQARKALEKAEKKFGSTVSLHKLAENMFSLEIQGGSDEAADWVKANLV